MKKFKINGISITRERVDTKSSQKKNEFKYPSFPILWSNSSIINRTSEIEVSVTKIESLYLVVARSLISSPSKAYRVTTVMKN